MGKILLILLSVFSTLIMADEIKMELNLADIQTQPYHKPYVAIWLETPKRQGVETLTIWHEKEDWLKDLRQWWRKLGRKNRDFDSVSSATRHAGSYPLLFNPKVEKGEYRICIEASREDGGREFLYQTIQLGNNKAQSYTLKGKHELDNIKITITPEKS